MSFGTQNKKSRRPVADVTPAVEPVAAAPAEVVPACAICRCPATLRYVVGIASAVWRLPMCSACDGERSPHSFDLDARLDAAARRLRCV